VLPELSATTARRDLNRRYQYISEVAYRWRFNDLSYFNKAFRAQFGTTPGRLAE
jgi:AraC-like DNA-binding protein